jgi:hypothetical protein
MTYRLPRDPSQRISVLDCRVYAQSIRLVYARGVSAPLVLPGGTIGSLAAGRVVS